MSKPLSWSSYQTYVECGHKYYLQNIRRIRPKLSPSYFAFGSAVDLGINALLLESSSPLEACETELRRLIVEPTEFFPADYDGELIDEATKTVLLQKCRELGYQGDNPDALAAALLARPYTELSENQRKALALCCTASLKAKAALMIDAYKRKVLPLIKSVDSIQQTLMWKDAVGNDFIGVLDVVVTFNDGTQVVADNKTSSRPYDRDAVPKSPQLAIYSKQTGLDKAAFFVMEKQVRKNRVKTCSKCGNVSTGRHKTCDASVPGERDNPGNPAFKHTDVRCGGEWAETIQPEVNIQILVDDVPATERQITQEALTDVATAIKAGAFPRNLKSCIQKFGQRESKCPYYHHCRNGSMDGLEAKPPSKD